MSRQPFRELTKHFSPERRARIEVGKARIREEVKREKGDRDGREPARRDDDLAVAGGDREALTRD